MPPLLILIRKLKSAQTRLRRWIASVQQDLVSWVVSFLTEKYWLIDYLPVKRPQRAQVLLVRLDLIGDFIIWLDSAKAYRQLYPTQRIVLYANAIWAGLAEQFDYWDEVVPVDVAKLRANDWFRLRQLVAIRERGFCVALQPTYSREYVADLVVRSVGAPLRIGHVGNLDNITLEKKTIADQWYSRLIDLSAQPVVELNLNAGFIRALGIADFKSAMPEIIQRSRLPKHLQITEPYFVIAPGASWAPKMWLAENFAKLAQEIHRLHQLKLVLCGTAAESHICEEVAHLAGFDAIILAGQTSLCEMVEVIRRAKFLLANDSAPVHIAAAVKTRSICILGGGHFGRFLPYLPETSNSPIDMEVVHKKMDCYGCNWKCKYLREETQVVPCIAEIPASTVRKLITEGL